MTSEALRICAVMTFLMTYVLFTTAAGTINTGSHQSMGVKVKHGGLQDFDGDDDPENQLKREEFVRNKEHIKEHLKTNTDFDPDTATPEELDFHFFKIHDENSDDKLDGLELLSAINHGLEEQYEKVEASDFEDDVKKRKMKSISTRGWIAVDRILREDDKDKDGYLTYSEYKDSRRVGKVLSGENKFS